ncbi:hypothetical protein J3Q64DRAFT_1039756 [Phycomyces blakesleeanus]|uniref:Uncharacterized protein n=1 Tax=Phycomyces blakesleeanus TaxID=4837 RepID=A0ABR3BDQ3_PHYBL
MSQQSIKVLVIGSVNSRFAETFKKVSSINNKHGPFDVLLCTGNFFQSENDESELISLMQGNIEVPITTYFITGDRPLPTSIEKRIKETDGEVCTNLFYLGKQGILTTAQGLKIAFMSGSFNKDIYNGTESSTGMHNNYLSSDIKRLQSTRMPITTPSGVDILLTYEWPSFITNGSNCSLETPLTNSSTPIAELAAALKPRYHFAASENVFYEREPYSNITGFGPAEERPAGHVSRFVGLADVLNPKKQRWFYAFNLIPMGTIDAEKLCIAPNNTTPCPFNLLLTGDQGVNAGQKRSQDDSQNNNGSFFWGDEQRNTKKFPQKIISAIAAKYLDILSKTVLSVRMKSLLYHQKTTFVESVIFLVTF